jgi:peptide/nickel transport system permease protein
MTNPTEDRKPSVRPLMVKWRRFRRNRLAMMGVVIILIIIAAGVFAPNLSPYDPRKQNLRMMNKPPSAEHWFGCDQMGRDIFSRILYGAAITLYISGAAVAMGLIVGSTVGIIGGFYGGKIDLLLTYVTDILLAFPGFLLAIAVVAAIGPGLTGVIIAAGFSSIPQFIRIARGAALGEKEREYITAARAIGENNLSIITRYLLPNCVAPLVILGTLRMAFVILIASGLSFLGLGAQPPSPEWGAMLSEGRAYLQTAPHSSIFPGLAIMILVLAFNLFGDGLRDALDPRMKL